MRDRSRQFADSRIAVEVCKLRQALARFDFGEMAAPPFMEQSADQYSLDQDDAAISDNCQLYFSQMLGSRNRTWLPGGRLLSLIPQRSFPANRTSDEHIRAAVP